MVYPPIVATDARDSSAYPLDFETVHRQGIPHRVVQMEIVNDRGEFFVWHRNDGRLEIPGGHVEWLEDQRRAESYEEAALRETIEELELLGNWQVDVDTARTWLRKYLSPIAKFVNQIPSSHGNNNEWVTAYSLSWQSNWGNPCSPGWKLGEGRSPCWLSLEEIEQCSLREPMRINAALRLFLRRRGILVPLV